MNPDIPEERRAPEGGVWVCCACGKTADDRYGMIGEHSLGWDVSCTLNAAAFARENLVFRNGRVIKVKGNYHHRIVDK